MLSVKEDNPPIVPELLPEGDKVIAGLSRLKIITFVRREDTRSTRDRWREIMSRSRGSKDNNSRDESYN